MPEEKGFLRGAAASWRQLRQSEAEPEAPAGLTPGLARLRAWQAARLARTYADMLHSRRFGPARHFFLSDVYAPRDFSGRDQRIHQLYDTIRHYLPPPLLHILREAISLNEMTAQLDEALVAELDPDEEITPEMYAAAYRRCDNFDARWQQIEMLVALGQRVDGMVKLPLVGVALKLAHRPAHRAGWGEVQDFLERGYAAFKRMKGADAFLETVRQRERRILQAIYEERPDPFALA